MPVFFGAALGNLLRGVPLTAEGWFELPLFTDFSARPPVGILDWYTVLVGLFALAALGAHGGAFIAWKTDGPLQDRSRSAAGGLPSPPPSSGRSSRRDGARQPGLPERPRAPPARPRSRRRRSRRDWSRFSAACRRRRERAAFLGSCAFLAGLSAATAACVYPVMLRATGDAALSMTVSNGAGDPPGCASALGWFSIGFPLALAYLAALFRMHRGKAVAASDGQGY